MEPHWFSLAQAVGCWDFPAAVRPLMGSISCSC